MGIDNPVEHPIGEQTRIPAAVTDTGNKGRVGQPFVDAFEAKLLQLVPGSDMVALEVRSLARLTANIDAESPDFELCKAKISTLAELYPEILPVLPELLQEIELKYLDNLSNLFHNIQDKLQPNAYVINTLNNRLDALQKKRMNLIEQLKTS